eukprot:5679268-Pleurochrysis_carterae.AAC.1
MGTPWFKTVHRAVVPRPSAPRREPRIYPSLLGLTVRQLQPTPTAYRRQTRLKSARSGRPRAAVRRAVVRLVLPDAAAMRDRIWPLTRDHNRVPAHWE